MSLRSQVRRSARKSTGNDAVDTTPVRSEDSDGEDSNPFGGGSAATSNPFAASTDDAEGLPLVSYKGSATPGEDSSSTLTKYATKSTQNWGTAATESTVALVSSAQEQLSRSWNITASILLLEMISIVVAKIKFQSITFGPHPWLLLSSPTPAFDVVLPNYSGITNLAFLESIFSYSLLTVLLPAVASILIAFPSASETTTSNSTPQKQFGQALPLSQHIASPHVIVFAIFRLAILILCNFILRNPTDLDDGLGMFPGDGEWSFSEDMYGFEEMQVLGAVLNLALVVLARAG